MSRRTRLAFALTLTSAAALWTTGCMEKGTDVVAHHGSYQLMDRDAKRTVMSTDLQPGDRARIEYMGVHPVRADWDRHYAAGTDEVKGWQWLALDPDGRYGFDKAK